MKIEIFDTTLRDGAQGAGVAFTEADRFRVIHALDDLGVSYIEAGNFALGSNDWDIFHRAEELGKSLKNLPKKCEIFVLRFQTDDAKIRNCL